MPLGCAIPRPHLQKGTGVQGREGEWLEAVPGARLSPVLPSLLLAVLWFTAAHGAGEP